MIKQRAILSNTFLSLLIGLIPLTAASLTHGTEYLEVGNFSSVTAGGDFPSGWELMGFEKVDRPTRYSLVDDSGIVVVKADSNASASGLVRRIKIDPREYPIVTWRWKITKTYSKEDITQKQGDDYPVRLIITFAYDPANLRFLQRVRSEALKILYGEYPPCCAINYIWSGKSSEEVIAKTPISDRSRMIVVQSGKAQLKTWVQEKRNIYEDYKKVFGQKPPMICAVAIMTDSDNTGESGVSFYGDIVFKKN